MTSPTLASLAAPRGGGPVPWDGPAGLIMTSPHARFARCPPRGRASPLGWPGGTDIPATLASLAAPRGGVPVPWDGPAGLIMTSPHARFARCPPRDRASPLGRPGGTDHDIPPR